MWIDVTMSDGTSVYVRASGGYAPDVMHDLQNRAATLMSHAAGINLQVTRELTAMGAAEVDTDPEDEDDEEEVAG